MNLLDRCKPALFLALLTKRMRLDVAVTDAFPCTTVAFVRFGVTLIFVVEFAHDLLVFCAVLLAVSKPTAAGVSTGSFWFVWHGKPRFQGIRKASSELLP